MALGFNRLAALPMALALLSSLRYLNLRNNHFTTFPDVVRAPCPAVPISHADRPFSLPFSLP
jgi:hypothetical protein